jgi:hypothetical protein
MLRAKRRSQWTFEPLVKISGMFDAEGLRCLRPGLLSNSSRATELWSWDEAGLVSVCSYVAILWPWDVASLGSKVSTKSGKGSSLAIEGSWLDAKG